MSMITRKPVTWVVLAILSVAGAWFSWRYFSRAFPLVSVDIRMDRPSALQQARGLATSQQLGPPGFSEAASFSLDEAID